MTRYSNPSNVKKSAPMCCHGHSGAGVGWSGCLGSGVSAMYHLVLRQFATYFPLGVQSIAVSSVPNWIILDPL